MKEEGKTNYNTRKSYSQTWLFLFVRGTLNADIFIRYLFLTRSKDSVATFRSSNATAIIIIINTPLPFLYFCYVAWINQYICLFSFSSNSATNIIRSSETRVIDFSIQNLEIVRADFELSSGVYRLWFIRESLSSVYNFVDVPIKFWKVLIEFWLRGGYGDWVRWSMKSRLWLFFFDDLEYNQPQVILS